ncbi:TlpA family protein disulfide reductase [Alicyclobacillus vulcanalis]|uniref:Thioredoxin domain-containing protein n=1 Tax=Alicyclobacillus vulcanalis TaxID=252246 RepID=A0A1N7NH69_9BACL|nr:hypothetical protein [Alicyclobacillus vulcanalis]SIS97763.1 hypothetical protein SAMN05421799_108132 [Alicyclobacillus vulcanalis]
MRRSWSVLMAVCMSWLAVGCGTPANSLSQATAASGRHAPHPLVFQNLTGAMNEGQDPRWDPKAAPTGVYDDVTVVTASGRQEVLSVRDAPLLFAAYWCPHCQRTLQLLTSIESRLKQKPILVNVGYPPGTTLQTAARIAREESQVLHLAPFQEVFILNPDAGDRYAPLGYPTLAFYRAGRDWTLYGEHRASIWEKALSESTSKAYNGSEES